MANTFYNRVIRKLVVGFGNLFNDITMVRYNPDNSESERFIVPIAYAAKEHYVLRLEEDFNLDKKVQMTLPRLSFEMKGMTYDSSRKQNTNIKNFAQTASGIKSQYNPVPYNFDFDLNLYVRNIEDGTQIIEHILPYFTPDYTIKLNLIPEMGTVKEIPIILNSVTSDTTYIGDRGSDPRMIVWTLNFTVKGFVFGPVSGSSDGTKVITQSIVSIYNKINQEDIVHFTMDAATGTGDYQLNEMVYQGYDVHNATATGKVSGWANNKLSLININGDFVSTQPIYGFRTSTNYKFTSYDLVEGKFAEINIVPDPVNANAASPWVANTTITEYE